MVSRQRARLPPDRAAMLGELELPRFSGVASAESSVAGAVGLR